MTPSSAALRARSSPLVASSRPQPAYFSQRSPPPPRRGHRHVSTAVNLARRRRSTQADHTLVAAAKTLEACTRANGAQPAAAPRARRACSWRSPTSARSERDLARVARDRASDTRRRRCVGTARAGADVTATACRGRGSAHVRHYVLMRRVPGAGYPVLARPRHLDDAAAGARARRHLRAPHRRRRFELVEHGARSPTPPKSHRRPARNRTARTTSPPETIDTQAAPAIVVSGKELKWNAIAGVSAYVLASIVPGQPKTSPRSAAPRSHRRPSPA